MATIIQLIFVSSLRRSCVIERNHVASSRRTGTVHGKLEQRLMPHEFFVIVPHRRAW
jgi:hypothetical protein